MLTIAHHLFVSFNIKSVPVKLNYYNYEKIINLVILFKSLLHLLCKMLANIIKSLIFFLDRKSVV